MNTSLVQLPDYGTEKTISKETHHFKLNDILEAYKVFGNASTENAMKVIIEP